MTPQNKITTNQINKIRKFYPAQQMFFFVSNIPCFRKATENKFDITCIF